MFINHRLCLIVLWCSLGMAAMAAPRAIDLFAVGEKLGLNETAAYRPDNIDRTTDSEFLAYRRAFVRRGKLRVFTVPAEDAPAKYRYTGVGPFPVDGMQRYTLALHANTRISSTDHFSVLFCATYFKQGKPILFETLYTFREAQAGMPRVEQDFGTPPGADAMILWMGVSNSPNRLAPGPKLIVDTLQIRKIGPLNGTPDARAVRQTNLLPVADFEDTPPGAYQPGRGVFEAGNETVAEIVRQDSHCLHLVKSPTSYLYPHFKSRKVNLDNCAVQLSFRIKGAGTIRPMIWWWLTDSNWDYYGGRDVVLTDQWQTVTLWRACITPGIDFAACAFAVQTSTADFYVDDISLKILPR